MASGNAHRERRRRLIIDKPAQLAMALTVTGMTAAGLVVLMASMWVLPVDAYFDRVAGADMRRALLIILGAFFTLTVVGITLSCVVLSHRFVGPAFVIRRGLDAMARGRYDERLTIRRRDYLQDLSESAVALRDVLMEKDDLVDRAIDRLDAGDAEGARELLAEIKHEAEPAPAPEPELAGVS